MIFINEDTSMCVAHAGKIFITELVIYFIKRRVLILIKNRLWIFFAKIVRDEMIIIIYFRIEYRIL